MADIEKKRARQRRYIARNRKQERDRSRDFRLKNRTAYNEQMRTLQAAWRKNNPASYLHRSAKARAKKAGLPFNIVPEDVVIPLFCPLLGIMLIPNIGGKVRAFNSPSLDRAIPELGYVRGNVRVVSYQANAMKQNATAEQLRTFALAILPEQKVSVGS